MKSALFTAVAYLAVAAAVYAGGAKEGAPAGEAREQGGGTFEARFRAFTLAEADNDGNRMYIERMAIPEAVQLAQWTRFSRVGRGVKMDSTAAYGLRQKRMAGQELSAAVIVQEWELEAVLRDVPKRGKQPVTVEVSFSVKDCLARGGRVLYQPARMAVTRAVTQENWGTGEARLVSIEKAGPGRFTASVDLR